jgi:hypothetical protein
MFVVMHEDPHGPLLAQVLANEASISVDPSIRKLDLFARQTDNPFDR